MKTQLTIAAAVLTLAACTPKFYPPQVATLLVRHDGRGRTLVGTLRRHDA